MTFPSASPMPTRLRLGFLFVLLGASLALGGPVRADDVLPQAPPASKYAKMAGHSPFAPPTAPITAQATPPPAPAPGWADSLTATMIAQNGADYMVTVVDSQNSQQHLYLTAEPDAETKIALVSVKWGANRDDPPTITLSKGKEFAQVRYEANASATGASNPGAGGGPPIPGAARNPPIPGGQGFHAPLQAGAVQTANPGAPGNALRRPLIRAQPGPAPLRSGGNLPTPRRVRTRRCRWMTTTTIRTVFRLSGGAKAPP